MHSGCTFLICVLMLRINAYVGGEGDEVVSVEDKIKEQVYISS